MDCEDCGPFVIVRPEGMTVFVLSRDVYAASICGNCDRSVTDHFAPEDKKEVLHFLLDAGVKFFSWHDGREIKTTDTLDVMIDE